MAVPMAGFPSSNMASGAVTIVTPRLRTQ